MSTANFLVPVWVTDIRAAYKRICRSWDQNYEKKVPPTGSKDYSSIFYVDVIRINFGKVVCRTKLGPKNMVPQGNNLQFEIKPNNH